MKRIKIIYGDLLVESVLIECPFCKKLIINVIYSHPFLTSKTERAGSNKKTVFFQTKEKYEVQSDCPNCGKKVKEIQRALNEGKKDPEKDKRILKRLKDQGLDFSNITTKF